jgi:YjbE family integral membrane protein
MGWSSDYMLALAVLQVICIDVILSGDNAVVIAMACRELPDSQRRIGLGLGVALAIVLRVVMASAVTYMLAFPFLKVLAGLYLLYIAIKLIKEEDEAAANHRSRHTLFGVVCVIAVADASMSLDNVMAIAAASGGSYLVFVAGLLLSMPFMIVGASLISRMISRFPILVWAGGGLLGWISGSMISTDPYVILWTPDPWESIEHVGSSAIGATLVLLVSFGFHVHARRVAAAHTLSAAE